MQQREGHVLKFRSDALMCVCIYSGHQAEMSHKACTLLSGVVSVSLLKLAYRLSHTSGCM